MPPPQKIGPDDFAQARRAQRARITEDRLAAQAVRVAALQHARDTFIEQSADLYASGASSAAADADVLEDLADQVASAVEALQPAFDRLDVARDVALYRGPTLGRMRSRYDCPRLAALAAEVLAEELLSGAAGAVLLAAIVRRPA